jgi:hypothetical protein
MNTGDFHAGLVFMRVLFVIGGSSAQPFGSLFN